MNEKFIEISINDEIVDSFIKEYSPLGIHFYCVHNNIEFVEALEFCGFVHVIAKWR